MPERHMTFMLNGMARLADLAAIFDDCETLSYVAYGQLLLHVSVPDGADMPRFVADVLDRAQLRDVDLKRVS